MPIEPGAMQVVLVTFNPRTKIGLHQTPVAAEDGTVVTYIPFKLVVFVNFVSIDRT